jgi:hypothetical protein
MVLYYKFLWEIDKDEYDNYLIIGLIERNLEDKGYCHI